LAAVLAQPGQDNLFGRSRVGRAFKNDEIALPAVRRNTLGGVEVVGDVGILRFAQSGGHTDRHGVYSGEFGVIGGRAELTRRDERLQDPVRDVFYVATASIQRIDLSGIDVYADDIKTGLCEGHRQWQADVPDADNADRQIA